MKWKSHPLYPNYLISEYGDVLTSNIKGEFKKRLRGTIDIDGYIRYHIKDINEKKNLITCHKLVIETFVGFAEEKTLEVAHANGSRLFNHYSNLSWKTSKKNHEDRVIHGTAAKGSNNGRAMLNESSVLIMRQEYKSALNRVERFKVINKWATIFNVSISAIYNAIKKKTWSHI